MTQGDLFPPYNGDPPSQAHSPTSQAAAESIKPKRGPLHKKIIDFLRVTGGANDEEMQWDLSMPPNTQRPRRRELQLMGDVVDSGTTRPTRSGRAAVVWKLA